MADTDTLTATPPRAARSAEADPLPAAPAAPPQTHGAPSVGPPVSELEFAGCKAVPMTREQFRHYESRLEFWFVRASRGSGTADPGTTR